MTREFTLASLHHRAKSRPDEYVQDVLAHAVRVTDTHCTLAVSEFNRLRAKYARKGQPPPQPVPRSEWPRIVRFIARFQHEGEVGVGDTLHRMADTFGAGRLAAKLKAAGIDCGCAWRRAWMNQRYPYSADTRA